MMVKGGWHHHGGERKGIWSLFSQSCLQILNIPKIANRKGRRQREAQAILIPGSSSDQSVGDAESKAGGADNGLKL